MRLKIKPIEGRMLLDPRTLGGEQRRLGYVRETVGTKMVLGKPEPRIRWRFVGGEFVVTETPDYFFRRAIVAGDVEYVAHVNDDDTTKRDPSLVAVSARHAIAREAERKLAAVAAEEAEAAEAAALDAAERGEDN